MNQNIQNEIIQHIKTDMIHVLTDLELYNINEKILKLRAALNILEEIPVLSENIAEEITPPSLVNDSSINPEFEEKVTSNNTNTKGYELIRKTKGAYANGRYIGESIIRQFNLEHGDIVDVTDHNGKPYVSLIKKGPGVPLQTRKQISYCLVEKKDGDYFVRIYHNGTDFVPIEIGIVHLDYEEIVKMNIQEQDLIDLAYMEDQPEKIDIIWKHNTERVNHVTPLPSSHYKKQDSSESGKATYTKYSELEGKRVLIIGGEDRHPDYRNAFELVGAKFEGLKGGAKHIQLESSIRKADVVVIVTCAVRTHTQEYAPYLCKEYQIPFTRVHNDGIESILQAAAYPKFPKHSQSEEEHHLDI